MDPKFIVYAIASLSNNYIYIGHTNNLERRLKEHNQGSTSSNRKMAPFVVIYQEEFITRSEAIKREKDLKKGYNREILKKMWRGGRVV